MNLCQKRFWIEKEFFKAFHVLLPTEFKSTPCWHRIQWIELQCFFYYKWLFSIWIHRFIVTASVSCDAAGGERFPSSSLSPSGSGSLLSFSILFFFFFFLFVWWTQVKLWYFFFKRIFPHITTRHLWTSAAHAGHVLQRSSHRNPGKFLHCFLFYLTYTLHMNCICAVQLYILHMYPQRSSNLVWWYILHLQASDYLLTSLLTYRLHC